MNDHDCLCGELGSWRREDGTVLCQRHNDRDLQEVDGAFIGTLNGSIVAHPAMPRVGVWEELEEQGRETLEEIRESFVPPQIDMSDFHAWIIQKSGNSGAPQGLLLKMAVIAINKLHDASDRWNRLEVHEQPSAPIWLSRGEADALVKALRGKQSATVRVLRQSIRDLFD
jgi:hypothetical protein